MSLLSTTDDGEVFGTIDDDPANATIGEDDREANLWPNCDASVWLRSCEEEALEPIDGKISGRIPSWLNGTLLRNGPGSLKVADYTFKHLFDSSALLHRFEIRDGNVTYQCRFVQTETYKKNRAARRITVTEFGTSAVPDPCRTIFQRIAAKFYSADDASDNSMISVYPFGDEYYTFTEMPTIHRIDPKTLATTGKVNVGEYVGIVNHTSHPHVMDDGTVYNLGLSVRARGPLYNVVRFPSSRIASAKKTRTSNEFNARNVLNVSPEPESSMFDRATIVASIPSRWILNPSYMHTFGITENYFVVVEQPLAISLTGVIASRLTNGPMNSSLRWHENENTLIHVICRETGTLARTFIAETFFFLHIVNQFETRDRNYVVIDICCYRDAKMLDCMYVEALKNIHKNPDYPRMFRGRPLRFVLPMKQPEVTVPPEQNLITAETVKRAVLTYGSDEGEERVEREEREEREKGKSARDDRLRRKPAAHRLADGKIFVKPELLCDLGCETPRINSPSFQGRDYRYFYAVSSDVDLDNPGTLVKVDIPRKTWKTWSERNVYPSEPIFVADPKGKEEDDGVILSSLVWGKGEEKKAGLLILDASNFREIARATFQTASAVPKCLHGWFIGAQ